MQLGPESIDLVNQILSNDDVYPWIGEGTETEYNTSLGAKIFALPGVVVLLPRPGILFVCVPYNSVMLEVHSAVVPEQRGVVAVCAGKEAISWVFTNTKFQKLVVYTPSFSRHGVVFSLECGFKKEGILKRAHVFKGVLHDLVITGIDKETWQCQSHQ